MHTHMNYICITTNITKYALKEYENKEEEMICNTINRLILSIRKIKKE